MKVDIHVSLEGPEEVVRTLGLEYATKVIGALPEACRIEGASLVMEHSCPHQKVSGGREFLEQWSAKHPELTIRLQEDVDSGEVNITQYEFRDGKLARRAWRGEPQDPLLFRAQTLRPD